MNDSKEDQPVPSIAERLRNSSGPPENIYKPDFARELARLRVAEDTQGVSDLYSALVEWETRFDGMRPPGQPRAAQRSEEQIHESVTRNLDVAAELADALTSTGVDEALAYRAVAEGSALGVGPVRQFYRETVGYQPEQPTTNPSLN